ncbi:MULTISPECIES: cytochrome oxidase putative small subunit CydP [unclassified Herbaspirillum]|uniref:cytochrome oxidase putative small subunit CydP n=1 Tax=unclassified Herbaspirillum TaxID=2624150 RepID=UPI0005CA9EF6|nr:cytochrome oxidase putative small subunit CydP [Herbaspirillum sp. B65]BEV16379.1 hypothetical protein HBDW_31670 [Herbaspirillum sp. DW155]
MQLTHPSRKRPWQWPRLTRLPLGVEITVLLVIKIALITVLAKTFFAHPEAKHMQMPVQSVEQRMLSFTSPAATAQHQDLSAKQQPE